MVERCYDGPLADSLCPLLARDTAGRCSMRSALPEAHMQGLSPAYIDRFSWQWFCRFWQTVSLVITVIGVVSVLLT
jgi:hypothetical protein